MKIGYKKSNNATEGAEAKKNKPARNYQGSFIEETYIWIKQFQNYSKRLLINEFNRLFFTNNNFPIIHLKR